MSPAEALAFTEQVYADNQTWREQVQTMLENFNQNLTKIANQEPPESVNWFEEGF